MCNENFYQETARQHLKRLGIVRPNLHQLKETQAMMFNVFISCEMFLSEHLSNREKQCIYYISIGKTPLDVAQLLEIKVDTVRKHQKSILKKLKCHTMAQAVTLAIKYGALRSSSLIRTASENQV